MSYEPTQEQIESLLRLLKWAVNPNEGLSAGDVRALLAAYEERGREVERLKGNSYPHMCRDGHPQIGHSDSEHEMCPLCRAEATLAKVVEALHDAWDRMDRAHAILHSDTAEWAMLDTKLARAALAAVQPEEEK